jgi:hypothetical protein
MNGYLETWRFTRERMQQSWEDLSLEQLHWRLHEDSASIAEHLLHVCGGEHWLGRRMRRIDPRPTEFDQKVDLCVRDGFLNDNPFPFTREEMDHSLIQRILDKTASEIDPMMSNITDDLLASEFETPLGPTADGIGGLNRLAQHPAYHTGQIWTIRLHPDFPKA